MGLKNRVLELLGPLLTSLTSCLLIGCRVPVLKKNVEYVILRIINLSAMHRLTWDPKDIACGLVIIIYFPLYCYCLLLFVIVLVVIVVIVVLLLLLFYIYYNGIYLYPIYTNI